jgi:membrane-associated phospholipid phosphatase
MFNLSQLYDHLKAPGLSLKLERLGDILQYAIPWAALGLIAFTGDVSAAWAWLYGCMTTILIVEILKYGLNHTKLGTRPNGGSRSFPSGHTAGAFAGAGFFLFYFGISYGIVAIALATLTGISRITSKHHWTRDVIAGAIIGLACTYHFIH